MLEVIVYHKFQRLYECSMIQNLITFSLSVFHELDETSYVFHGHQPFVAALELNLIKVQSWWFVAPLPKVWMVNPSNPDTTKSLDLYGNSP